MALDSNKITQKAIKKLQAAGFIVDGEFSKQRYFVQAIIEALVEDIEADTEVKGEEPVSDGFMV